MKKWIGFLAVAALLTSSTLVVAAMEQEGKSGSTTQSQLSMTSGKHVTGDLQKIEGQNYTIKDAAGKEVRFVVDKDTKVQGQIKEGDRIEAQIAQDGTADSLKKASGSESSSSGKH